jgi:hypothetical protein
VVVERPRSGIPTSQHGREAQRPFAGDYNMGKEEGRREKNLHELAQSNSYTYTL